MDASRTMAKIKHLGEALKQSKETVNALNFKFSKLELRLKKSELALEKAKTTIKELREENKKLKDEMQELLLNIDKVIDDVIGDETAPMELDRTGERVEEQEDEDSPEGDEGGGDEPGEGGGAGGEKEVDLDALDDLPVTIPALKEVFAEHHFKLEEKQSR